MAVETFITRLGKMHIRECAGGNTKVGVSSPGGMATDAGSQHIGIPLKSMVVCKSAAGDRGPVDMAVTAGTMTRGAVGIVSLDLVLGQLVKLLMSGQPHPLGYFALLAGPLVQARDKIGCNVCMTGPAFLCVLLRRMLDEIPGMGNLLFMCSVGTPVTGGTANIMITGPEFPVAIIFRIKKNAVIRFETGRLTSASAHRGCRIRGVHINQVFIIGMTPYAGCHITVIRDLVLCTSNPD
jgi:hypothetical protein